MLRFVADWIQIGFKLAFGGTLTGADIAVLAAWVARKGDESIFPEHVRQVDRAVLRASFFDRQLSPVAAEVEPVLESFEAAAAFEAEDSFKAAGDDDLPAVAFDVQVIGERGLCLDGVLWRKIKKSRGLLTGESESAVWQGSEVDLERGAHGVGQEVWSLEQRAAATFGGTNCSMCPPRRQISFTRRLLM